MYRAILILIVIFIHISCTHHKGPEVVFCLNKGEELSTALLDTAKYSCNIHYGNIFGWWKDSIAESDLLWFQSMRLSNLVYSNKMNKIFYYQTSNFLNDEMILFDSLYNFKKGTSILLNNWITEFSKPPSIKTLEDVLGTLHKVPTVELVSEMWSQTIIPYLKKAMLLRGIPHSLTSINIDKIELELMNALRSATEVYVSRPTSVNSDSPVNYIGIYIFNSSLDIGDPFVYYEFEI